jgi:hypothetical protein
MIYAMDRESEHRPWIEGQFAYNDRLGIRVPRLTIDWDGLSPDRQIAVLACWEMIRGNIPDRIKRFEEQIDLLQHRLNEEEDFVESCRLNGEIAELASRINDLQIWYRTQQDLERESKPHG